MSVDPSAQRRKLNPQPVQGSSEGEEIPELRSTSGAASQDELGAEVSTPPVEAGYRHLVAHAATAKSPIQEASTSRDELPVLDIEDAQKVIDGVRRHTLVEDPAGERDLAKVRRWLAGASRVIRQRIAGSDPRRDRALAAEMAAEFSWPPDTYKMVRLLRGSHAEMLNRVVPHLDAGARQEDVAASIGMAQSNASRLLSKGLDLVRDVLRSGTREDQLWLLREVYGLTPATLRGMEWINAERVTRRLEAFYTKAGFPPGVVASLMAFAAKMDVPLEQAARYLAEVLASRHFYWGASPPNSAASTAAPQGPPERTPTEAELAAELLRLARFEETVAKLGADRAAIQMMVRRSRAEGLNRMVPQLEAGVSQDDVAAAVGVDAGTVSARLRDGLNVVREVHRSGPREHQLSQLTEVHSLTAATIRGLEWMDAERWTEERSGLYVGRGFPDAVVSALMSLTRKMDAPLEKAPRIISWVLMSHHADVRRRLVISKCTLQHLLVEAGVNAAVAQSMAMPEGPEQLTPGLLLGPPQQLRHLNDSIEALRGRKATTDASLALRILERAQQRSSLAEGLWCHSPQIEMRAILDSRAGQLTDWALRHLEGFLSLKPGESDDWEQARGRAKAFAKENGVKSLRALSPDALQKIADELLLVPELVRHMSDGPPGRKEKDAVVARGRSLLWQRVPLARIAQELRYPAVILEQWLRQAAD